MKNMIFKKTLPMMLAVLMLAGTAAVPAFAGETGAPLTAPNPLAAGQADILIAPSPLIAGKPDILIAPADGANEVYNVVKGDTLWSIAQKLLGSGSLWRELYDANKDTIKNPRLIFVGQVLKVPTENEEPVIGGMQIPNPFINCDTMTEAADLAGFSVVLPKAADMLQAVKGSMIQALYGDNGSDMTIRKAAGSGDISGDYNVYAQTEIAGDATLKGANDTFSLAIWEKDGYTYSVSVSQALSQAAMLELVYAIQ